MNDTTIIEVGTFRGFEIAPKDEAMEAGLEWGYCEYLGATPVKKDQRNYHDRVIEILRDAKTALTKAEITRIGDAIEFMDSGQTSRAVDLLVKDGIVAMSYESRLLTSGGGGAGKCKWAQGTRTLKTYYLYR